MNEDSFRLHLQKFHDLMIARIKENQERGDWHDKNVLDILLKLFTHLNELFMNSLKMDWDSVLKAAVDCANLSFFLADKTGLLTNGTSG